MTHQYPPTPRTTQPNCNGFTYVELLIAVTITAILMAGLMGVINTATQTSTHVIQRNDQSSQAGFAMQRMVRTVSHSRQLLLPQNDNPNTNWPENIREQTVPASAPIGDSTLATAVLAVTLPADVDLDKNSYPDADNDSDGLIDEDLPADIHNDDAAGIYLIDDGGNGTVDEGNVEDDDEKDDTKNEDPVNGLDDDGDGSIDEDPPADISGDGCSGICGVDDDNNGTIDEGNLENDDEQGDKDEDWYDPVVYYLDTGVLKQRMPVPWDTNADSVVTGADFIISDIAKNVTLFRVERINSANGGQSVDIKLELSDPDSGETISLQTRVRVGGAL